MTFLLCGCAISQELVILDKNTNQGELLIQFSDGVSNPKVVFNNKTIDTRKRTTKEIHLKNVASGKHTLTITASSWDLTTPLYFEKEVIVLKNQQTGVVVSTPPKSKSYWASHSATFIAAMLVQTNYVRPLLIVSNLILKR